MRFYKSFKIFYMKIICFFFLFFIKANCQNLYIEYGVTIFPEKEILEKDETLKKYYLNAIENAKQLNFGLICTSENSKFFNITDSQILASSKGTDLLFAGYSGIVFDLKKHLLSQSSLLGDNIFVKKQIVNDWQLINEKKEINGYTCYKATSFNVIKYGEKVFKHPITAWFCPEIPYSFGPNGYGNLPGLILELQVRNVVYGVKKIEFDSKKTFDIDKKNMKILSELEFEKALDKLNDF